MHKIDLQKTSWDFTPLFKSDDDPTIKEKREVLKNESYKFINKWKDRTDYLKDPSILKEALDEYEEWAHYYGDSGDEGFYLGLRLCQEQGNAKLKAKYNQIKDISVKIENDIQFFTHRLSKVSEDKQQEFLNSDDLKDYRHFLFNLFKESQYLLSEEEEKILNLVSPTAYSNWVRMVDDFLGREEREVLTEEGKNETKPLPEIASLLSSTKKEVRDKAAEELNDILENHTMVAEAEMNSILDYKKTTDTLRGVSRPDLFRHLSDDIESEVVDALLDSVSSANDVSRRYYTLKARLFGVEKLGYHERNVPYGSLGKMYSWEQSVDMVYKTLAGLDIDFGEIFANLINQGSYDVFPRKGKSGGAFCTHNLLTQPIYVMLNHTGKLNDVLTLAHESGHAINNILMYREQNALNASTPLSTAEVASTFMEDYVLQSLYEEADDEMKLALMMTKLNDDVSTIFRQVAAYRFEQELHTQFREKGYLSKEEIGKLFQKYMQEYMGDAVEQSPGSENWWVGWSHFRSFFYVYSYASGLLISKSLQNFVKNDPKFIEKVKVFLSSGAVDSPRNIFLKMGVDIADTSFWSKGLSEVEELLTETEELAKKLGKTEQV